MYENHVSSYVVKFPCAGTIVLKLNFSVSKIIVENVIKEKLAKLNHFYHEILEESEMNTIYTEPDFIRACKILKVTICTFELKWRNWPRDNLKTFIKSIEKENFTFNSENWRTLSKVYWKYFLTKLNSHKQYTQMENSQNCFLVLGKTERRKFT